MTQRALGSSIGVDKSTMVLLLDDFEANEYVKRVRHPYHRRAFLLGATDAGRSAQKRAIELLDAVAEAANIGERRPQLLHRLTMDARIQPRDQRAEHHHQVMTRRAKAPRAPKTATP
jgi:DNA-binding MarR family transcriptional regulator